MKSDISFILNNPEEYLVEEVAEDIGDGKTCIYPTETCYGLGTNALDKGAVKKIYEMKGRPKEEKLTCIVSSLEKAQKYCKLSRTEKQVCKEFMPGPLTLVAEKKENVPDLLNDKFVFRISSNEIAKLLSEKAKVPLVATSANLSGAPNNYSIKEISRLLKDKADYIINSGDLEPTQPSTILELEDGEPKIWREGPVSKGQIQRFL